MATEIITSYPVPYWRQPQDSFGDITLTNIERRLGVIEDQLSRIISELSRNDPVAK